MQPTAAATALWRAAVLLSVLCLAALAVAQDNGASGLRIELTPAEKGLSASGLPTHVLKRKVLRDGSETELAMCDDHAASVPEWCFHLVLTNSYSVESGKSIFVQTRGTALQGAITSRRMFTVRHQDGSELAYSGVMMKRMPAQFPADYIELKAGESARVAIDLSQAFLFEAGKSYTVAVGRGAVRAKGAEQFAEVSVAMPKAITHLDFQVSTASVHPAAREDRSAPQILRAVHSAATATGTLNATALQLSRARLQSMGTRSCSGSDQATLSTAVDNALAGLDEAHDVYLDENRCSGDDYIHWFGAPSISRWSEVKATLRLAKRLLTGAAQDFTLNCGGDQCTDDTYAYVFPTDIVDHNIYLCNAFFAAPLSLGTDSKPGTLVHESSHFNDVGQTDDFVYGQTDAHDLAGSNPDHAVDNADNYEYFTETGPSSSPDSVCDPCRSSSDCDTCADSNGCGYCSNLDTCYTGFGSGPVASTCSGSDWETDSAACDPCSVQSNCDDCNGESGCGWCTVDGHGACRSGNDDGPEKGTCSGTWKTCVTCGNGLMDGGEECDSTLCCSNDCQIADAGTVCRKKADEDCQKNAVCDGSDATCPENDVVDDGKDCRRGGTCYSGFCFCGEGICAAGSSSSDSKTATVGGVVGAAVFVLIVVAICYYCCKRRRQKSATTSNGAGAPAGNAPHAVSRMPPPQAYPMQQYPAQQQYPPPQYGAPGYGSPGGQGYAPQPYGGYPGQAPAYAPQPYGGGYPGQAPPPYSNQPMYTTASAPAAQQEGYPGPPRQ